MAYGCIVCGGKKESPFNENHIYNEGGIQQKKPTIVTEGRKDDKDKLRFDLIPVRPLEEVARVYTIGASKYDDRNWERGLSWGRVFAALMRHAWAWWRGELRDAKDSQHHLASVAWCALALMEYERTHPELDDRPKEVTLTDGCYIK